jgi:hypothetical protein
MNACHEFRKWKIIIHWVQNEEQIPASIWVIKGVGWYSLLSKIMGLKLASWSWTQPLANCAHLRQVTSLF